MKARIPKHREFVIDMKEVPEAQRDECWGKLSAILDAYKKRVSLFTRKALLRITRRR